jgi:P-type Ca2+ transporter type 2C
LALGVDPPSSTLMTSPPRPPHEGVITHGMWIMVGIVGVVMAAGTLLVLDACMPGGFLEGSGDLRYGRTMAFTTLVLFQLFNALNCRSDRDSGFVGLLRNRWLLGAIAISLALQALVVHAPLFQNAFETADLSLGDWFACLCVGSVVMWVTELVKLIRRRPLPRVMQPSAELTA